MNYIASTYNLSNDKLNDNTKSLTHGTIFCNNHKLYTNENGKIKITDQGNPNKYITSINPDDVLNDCINLIKKYSQINYLSDKEFISVLSGSVNELNNNVNNPSLFSVTNKITGEYFDLVVYFISKNKIVGHINYSNKTYQQFNHSGDIGSLLHTVSGINYLQNGDYAIICAIGYNKVPLIRFKTQTPSVCINNGNNIFVIPCTLEHALLGDNGNIITLAIIKKQNNNLILQVPIKPNVLNGINVGDTSDNVKNMLIRTINECSTIIKPHVEKSIEVSDNNNTNCCNENKYDYFYAYNDGGYDEIFDINDDKWIKFKFGSKNNSLPISETISGSIGVLSATPNEPNIDWNCVEMCKTGLISIDPNKFMSTCRNMNCSHLFNGLFILVCKVNGNVYDELLNNRIKLEEYMNTIPTNFMSMCGQQSIITVKLINGNNLESKYFWYEGIRKSIFIDIGNKLYRFGDDITDKMMSWYESTITQQNYVSDNWIINNQKYDDIVILFKQIVDQLFSVKINKHTLPYYEIKHIQYDIDEQFIVLDELIRKMKILTEKTVESVRNDLIAYIKSKSTDVLKDVKLIDAYDLNDKNSFLNAKLKSDIIKFSKQIVGLIGKLYSNRSSSSRNFSLKALERKETIKNNVANVAKMTVDEYAEYIENTASNGSLIINISRHFYETIENNRDTKKLEITFPSYLLLDEMTSSAIISTMADKPRYDMLDHCRHISVPLSSSDTQNASILIPINDYANKKRLEGIIWTNETQKPEFATFRIMLRSCISGIRNSGFSPSSSELTKFIINFYISTLEHLIPHNNNALTTIDFNDTIPMVIRGIFCHLMATFASGNKPYSQLYTLFYDNQILSLDLDEFRWLYRILNVINYTGYDCNKLYINAKSAIVNYIFKLLNVYFEKSQKNIKNKKQSDVKEYLKNKTLELQWLKLVAETIALTPNHKLTKPQIDKLYQESLIVEMMKTNSQSVKNIINGFRLFLQSNDLEYDQKYLNDLIAKITLKRAGTLKTLKKNLAELVLTKDIESLQSAYTNKINELMDKLKLTYNAPSVELKPQNQKLMGSTEDFFNSIRGDAEIKRIPWVIDKDYMMDKNEHDVKLKNILGNCEYEIKVDLSTNTIVNKEKSNSDIINKLIMSGCDQSLIDIYEEIYKLDTCEEIYHKLHQLNKTQDIIPYVFIIKMCETLKLNHPNIFFKDIINILFVNWSNTELGREKAINSLNKLNHTTPPYLTIQK